ncbi:MAG: hypothetical protein H0T89_34685 [Deltaproteobacteria bacterium]|nr:hypothetical protein [Deltaproteobacteria bacterium]MDQ3301267.1 hypothetical protein [Myxococcota bacterium]
MRSFLLLALLTVAACKSSDKEAPAGLAMSSSSAACKKAMKCCELYAKLETPSDLNLKCSGVALAKTDADCDLFRQGHASAFESKGTAVPADCK